MLPLVKRLAVPATTVIWPQVLVCAEAKPRGILTREQRTAGAVPWPKATQLVSNCHPDCFQKSSNPTPLNQQLTGLSRNCTSHQHIFRVTKDKQINDVQQGENNTLSCQQRGAHQGKGKKYIK